MITIKDEEILFDLADLFKVFGDSTRLRIMNVLFSGPTCVCEIAEVLDMSQSSISHQLKRLKDNNLVSSKRSGRSMYYELADDHVKTIFKTGLEHIKE